MPNATRLCTILALTFAASPAGAGGDPNATINAETARIQAETARINAQAALTSAKAAQDKAAIEALGLPKFDNKTELVDKGGAIETAMLSSRAVSAAAGVIASNVGCKASASPAALKTVVVLAGDEKLDLNFGKTMLARFGYHRQLFEQAMPEQKPPKSASLEMAGIPIPLITGLVSAAAGLFGNDTTVSGVELPEIGNRMLANAVAGAFDPARCKAILPSAGGGIANITNSQIATELTALVKQRNEAAQLLARIPEKPKPAQKASGDRLKAAIGEFDEFYKAINTIEADGQTDYVRAILVEKIASETNALLLRIVIDRAGGTITNSKNIGTFFGADPVRVTGGLVASYALVAAGDGQVKAAGTIACQTAQARLRNVQSGNWYATGDARKSENRAKAVCQ